MLEWDPSVGVVLCCVPCYCARETGNFAAVVLLAGQ